MVFSGMMESAVSQQKNCRSSGLELGQHRTASFTRKPQPVLSWNQEGPHEKAKVSRSTVLLPGTRGICKSSYLLAATMDPIQPALSFSESRVAVDTVSRRVFPKTWPSSAQTKPLRLCMVAGGSLQRLVSKVSKASLRQWLVSSPLLS